MINRQLDIFVLIGIGLACWELYVAYKNQNDTEEIKKGLNIREEG